MFRKIPGAWGILLLCIALSACDSNYVPGPTALCQPGVCVGSTPDSTPTSILEMMP